VVRPVQLHSRGDDGERDESAESPGPSRKRPDGRPHPGPPFTEWSSLKEGDPPV
jgi:hypothetical protein